MRASDTIAIQSVHGARDVVGLGDALLVRGRYALGSADDATLGLYVTAVRRGDGCTSGDGGDSVLVRRGAGTFELRTRMPYAGEPHVTFYARGANVGGVYFRVAQAQP